MNYNAALTLTSKHTYLPTTKPPPTLLGLVDSLENSAQNNVLLPLLFLLLIWYRDGANQITAREIHPDPYHDLGIQHRQR